MFISGYGLMTTYARGTFKLQRRLKKILFPFWFILILAIPLLLYTDTFSITEVLKNAFLISSSINGAWWFLQTYVLFVLFFPLFAKTFQNKSVYIPLLLVSLIVFQPLGVWLMPWSYDLHYVFHYFPLLYVGMFAKRMEIFDKLQTWSIFFKLLATVVLLALRFALGWNILNIGLVIMMILWVMQMQDILHDRLKGMFNFLGRMTMNMWLIHMFFIQYGFHFSNPFVDLCWLYTESLIAAFVISLAYNKLSGFCDSLCGKSINNNRMMCK